MSSIELLVKAAIVQGLEAVATRANGAAASLLDSICRDKGIQGLAKANTADATNAEDAAMMPLQNLLACANAIALGSKDANEAAKNAAKKAERKLARKLPKKVSKKVAKNTGKKNVPLANIFNNFAAGSEIKTALIQEEDKSFCYPSSVKKGLSASYYAELSKKIKTAFSGKSVENMSINELLALSELYMSYIPAEVEAGNNEVSLYIKTKMVAALASALYQTEEANNGTGSDLAYKNILMISGDISGIQDFIYTIPSKGALKSLRGRSFYLEIFLENFLDELLGELGLSRANVLYTGGGHFYLLAGNTESVKEKISEVGKVGNRWLLKNFGSKLYLALGFASCSGKELMDSASQRSVFAAVSRAVNKEKLCRYDGETLDELFSVDSEYNRHAHGSRECGICHKSSKNLSESYTGEGYICPSCLGLYKLGESLLDKGCIFAVSTEAGKNAMPIFGYRGERYLNTMPEGKVAKSNTVVRIYSKNSVPKGLPDSIRINVAEYCTRTYFGTVAELSELADLSCGLKRGINRLGVLRADVDNLGAAFIGGFANCSASGSNITKYATLSNNMSKFFKNAIDEICSGRLPKDQKAFSIFGPVKKERKVHVVYSGGDDMFIVGAWDDLIELAVDIREAFRAYTNDMLSFSAGMAMFTPSFPISRMADLTGMLESAAKQNPGKDSIALFGFDTELTDKDTELKCQHIYSWEQLESNVKEKLDFLRSSLDLENKRQGLPIGKGQLYRFMGLLDEVSEDDIKLARFVYMLGRMQPQDKRLRDVFDKFSAQMYKWYRDENDRQELYTAITLLVYYLRNDEEV